MVMQGCHRVKREFPVVGTFTMTGVMATDTFGQRMFHAFTLLRLRRGELSQAWVADQLGKVMGKREGYSPSAVSRWMGGQEPGELETIIGLAQVLEVDPGWLAFGDASRAPAPSDPTRNAYEAI